MAPHEPISEQRQHVMAIQAEPGERSEHDSVSAPEPLQWLRCKLSYGVYDMTSDSITLKHLRYFLEVAERGSFSKASSAMDIDQPTLSRIIKRIETEFDCLTFYRNGRGVTLTPRGQELFDIVSLFLNQVGDLRERLNTDRSAPKGNVSFAAVHHLSEKLIPQILVEFSRQCPDIHVHLFGSDSGTVRDNILNGVIDLGIFYDAGSSDLVIDPITEERMYVVGLRRLAEEHGLGSEVTTAKLEELTFVLPGTHHGLRRHVENHASRCGIALRVKFEIDMLQALRQLIRLERCFTILPSGAISDTTSDPDMYCAPIVAPDLRAVLNLAFARGRPIGSAVQQFSHFLRTRLKERVPQDPSAKSRESQFNATSLSGLLIESNSK